MLVIVPPKLGAQANQNHNLKRRRSSRMTSRLRSKRLLNYLSRRLIYRKLLKSPRRQLQRKRRGERRNSLKLVSPKRLQIMMILIAVSLSTSSHKVTIRTTRLMTLISGEWQSTKKTKRRSLISISMETQLKQSQMQINL